MTRLASTLRTFLLLSLVSLAACGGPDLPFIASDLAMVGAGHDLVGAPPADSSGMTTRWDGGGSTSPDLAQPSGTGDGTPMRQACTNSFGSALSGGHGRLDGYLISTVMIGAHGCFGDRSHVHLQVQTNGAVYDVAVTMVDNKGSDVFFAEKDAAMPDGPWTEGWHANYRLDYTTDFGVHAGDFAATPSQSLEQKVLGELQSANHISVWATPYGSSGCHLVHRQNGGVDGAIVINPLSPTPHFLLFHFANQSF